MICVNHSAFAAFSKTRTVLVCLFFCLMILFCGDLFRTTKSAGVPAVIQQGPQTIGKWSSEISLPLVAIHMHLLPDGKVLLFQDDNNPNFPINGTRLAGYTVAYVWDVGSGVLTQVDNMTKNEFCSGHAFLPDGRLFLAGGNAGQDTGSRDTSLFDFSNNTWIQTNQPMAQSRWYPSCVTLGNGEVAVVADLSHHTPEVWQTNSGGGWRVLSNATLGLALYPYMHLAPNGKVFVSGPEVTTRYLDTSGTGSWTTVATRAINADRDYGSSVMYDVGKVVIIAGGSGNPALSSAEVIDLNQPSPTWTTVGNMAFPRRQLNSTILPDGRVLVTGGATSFSVETDPAGAVLAAEMWNPQTGNFTTMASMATHRLYHSTAILLPDGRVLTAGGGRPGPEQRNAQIYSPPYLFTTGGAAATRPTIDSHLSTRARPGQTIFVTTPDAASITNVTLVGLSSVTHARNMNQRFNRLTFTQGAGGLNVTMPADANACPPGYYMLFILNSNGVPSLAKFINIKSSNPQPPSAPTNLVATATSTSSVALTWNAAAGSVDHYEIQRSTSRHGPFTTLTSTTGTTFTDNSLSSGTTYVYRVRAVDSQGCYSDFSNTDIATTIIFTDTPLIAGVTVVKAQHITELRQAVNAVRAAAGLSAASWTDSSLPGVNIKAVHITELRSNLDQALSLLGISTNPYTDSALTPGVTVVKAVHVQDLRNRVN